jgi:hypothetical protein
LTGEPGIMKDAPQTAVWRRPGNFFRAPPYPLAHICWTTVRPRHPCFIPIRSLLMTITMANVPAIVALLAGILILLMPRLLNFVVAIYLIFIGLVGLGVFKMLKF